MDESLNQAAGFTETGAGDFIVFEPRRVFARSLAWARSRAAVLA